MMIKLAMDSSTDHIQWDAHSYLSKLTHNIMVTENEEKARLEVKEKIKSQSNHNLTAILMHIIVNTLNLCIVVNILNSSLLH